MRKAQPVGLPFAGRRQYEARYSPSRPNMPSVSAVAIAPLISFSPPKFHSLTPILDSLPARADAWHQVTGYRVGVTEGDLCDWPTVERLFQEFQPETIIHYGEQPSAPYSYISREHAVFTQQNNVISTLNALWAMRDLAPNAHLVKLGTMGEYGTPNIDIEEGYITIQHNGREDRLPADALRAGEGRSARRLRHRRPRLLGGRALHGRSSAPP